MSLLDRLKQLFADARGPSVPPPSAPPTPPTPLAPAAAPTDAVAPTSDPITSAAPPPVLADDDHAKVAAPDVPPPPASAEAPVTVAPVIGSPDGRERRIKPRLNARPGTKVLVVDDSSTIVALLARMLRQNHFEVFEAADAETGLEIARRDAPELIFLDIVLPGMNGFTALRHLRREPATKATPVIMISGNEQATEQFYVQRIGADDFMKKPFSRAEVFARIERLLDAERVPRRPGTVAEAAH